MAMQGAFGARRSVARPADLADYGPQALFFIFFFQTVIFIACGPDFVAFGQADLYYRVFQTLWGAAVFAIAVWMSQRFGLRLSGTAKAVALFLFASAVIQYASQAFGFRTDYKFESFQTTLLFLAMFLGLDLLARRFTFAQFCSTSSWIAAGVIVASAVHMMFFATRIWDRALYFNLHPNLGGEIVFSGLVLVAFNPRAWLRFGCYALGLYALFELQSRAAMLGAVIMIAIIEVPLRFESFRLALVLMFAGLAAMCVAMLAVPSIGQKAQDFVAEDVFKSSDPYRGAGTGLVGRTETWAMAYQRLVERPLTGTGLNLSGKTILGDPVHNGYIKNLAEFGVPGMFLNLLLLAAIPMAWRTDRRRGVIVLACNIIYFFNARNVNLSVYPMVLWISILPWAPSVMSRAPAPAAVR